MLKHNGKCLCDKLVLGLFSLEKKTCFWLCPDTCVVYNNDICENRIIISEMVCQCCDNVNDNNNTIDTEKKIY